ncbi:PorP/SprF family type IX secretion system membrane protein [Ascidiimonas sp. W6]|uniref:PorP/SprF family type IX secretion system membrane protein n=1 Tax=Ascidiimonas meishanensis TaxID=3128903 RepID=UPI0030EE770C
MNNFNFFQLKNCFILLLFLLISNGIKAQQDPQYTQYLYNLSIVNPAYASDQEGLLNLGVLYRAQWSGVDGAPKTFNAFAHAPLGKNIEAGISIVRDDIGDGALIEDNINVDFAYVLQLARDSKLSLGVKAGITNFKSDLNGFVFDDPQADPAFNQNINESFGNLGVGAFYFDNKFFAGFSALNLLKAKHLNKRDGLVNRGSEQTHFYLTSGYTFDVNGDSFKLKPSVLLRGVKGAPLIVDLNLNAILFDKFEFGVGYRTTESIIGMFNLKLTPQTRIGYAYDYSFNNLGDFGSGSHEVFLLFDFDLTRVK